MAKPSAPSSATLSRSGPRAGKISWAKVSGASSYGIRYLRDDAAPPFTRWVSGLKGTSYSFKDLPVDSRYRFVVYAENKDGTSGYTNVAPLFFYTPPARPGWTTFTHRSKPGGGSEFELTWAAYYARYYFGTQIERDEPGVGTTYFEVGDGVSALSVTRWVDPDPPSGNTQYRMRYFVGAAGADRVYSPWGTGSGIIDLKASPPGPPTVTATSVLKDPLQRPTVAWQHNMRSGLAQFAAEVQYRLGSSGAWTTVNVDTSGDPDTWSIPGSWDAYENPEYWYTLELPANMTAGLYEVQVRTKNSEAAYGGWSAVQNFRVISYPTVSITSPETTYTGGRTILEWSYAQAEGVQVQKAYGAVWKNEALLGQVEKVGPGTRLEVPGDLQNATTYEAALFLTLAGNVSFPATKTFTTDFIRPAVPALVGGWDEQAGAHILEAVAVGEPDVDTSETVALDVYRSLDDGQSWEALGDFLDAGQFTDYGGRSNGQTWYRLVASSALGALSTVEAVVESDSPAVWVATAGMVQAALRCNLRLDPSSEPAHSELVFFDGETVPTLREDSPKSFVRSVAVQGSLVEGEDGELSGPEFVRVLETAGVVQYRDPSGLVLEASVRNVSAPSENDKITNVSFTVREVTPA